MIIKEYNFPYSLPVCFDAINKITFQFSKYSYNGLASTQKNTVIIDVKFRIQIIAFWLELIEVNDKSTLIKVSSSDVTPNLEDEREQIMKAITMVLGGKDPYKAVLEEQVKKRYLQRLFTNIF